MSQWTPLLTRLLAGVEREIDERRRSSQPVDFSRLEIHPYRGWGTAAQARITGRVLYEKTIVGVAGAGSPWENLLDSYRYFQSDEVPGVRLRVRFDNRMAEAVTDDEGYFEVTFDHAIEGRAGTLWHPVEIELAEPSHRVAAQGFVLIPPREAEFAVVSDIDDTVIHTQATNLIAMLRTVFFESARTRLPLPGVASLYRALQRGVSSLDVNPIFYVSSGPWNLFRLLSDFFELNGIPPGPLFLQDWGLDTETLISKPHEQHKTARIGALLDAYPHLPFILIGDSGQHDPEIYREIALAWRGRIPVIYIRDAGDAARDAEVRALAEDLRVSGSEMQLISSSSEAAADLLRRGLIAAEALREVEAESSHR